MAELEIGAAAPDFTLPSSGGSMYGKTYMGIERSTFLIDEHGKIARIWRRVKPAEHASDVLAALGA